ncbi:hypothetical protein AAFF27_24565 [Xylophilus sp. GW821-FHT01B05]
MNKLLHSLLLACALGAASAHAADAPATSSAPGCIAANKVGQAQLVGRWEVRFADRSDTGTMTLAPHPDFANAVRGSVSYGDATAQVAGDADEGIVAIDASSTGKSITALWEGQVSAGSCGRKIEGTWTDSATDSKRAFVLRKLSP